MQAHPKEISRVKMMCSILNQEINKETAIALFYNIMLLVLAVSLLRGNESTTTLHSVVMKPIFTNQS